MITPPRHLIPTSVCLGFRVNLLFYLTCNFYFYFEIDNYLVSWPFFKQTNKTIKMYVPNLHFYLL
jgi:hypothetical protein